MIIILQYHSFLKDPTPDTHTHTHIKLESKIMSPLLLPPTENSRFGSPLSVVPQLNYNIQASPNSKFSTYV